jgi:hypothetical protein
MATTKQSGGSRKSSSSGSKKSASSKKRSGSRKSAGSSGSGMEELEKLASEVAAGVSFEKLGLSEDRVRSVFGDIDISDSLDRATEFLSDQVEKAREYTRKNSTAVAGVAAGVLAGASLLAYALNRYGDKSGSSSKKAGSSSKKSGSSSKKSSSRKASSKSGSSTKR